MKKDNELICDCCETNKAIGVYASSMGAVSFAYCRDCALKGLEPYGAIVSYVSCGCNSFKEMDDTYKEIVKTNLDFYGKTIEEFDSDIERTNKEMEQYYWMDEYREDIESKG